MTGLVPILFGPTASGKSGLAAALAEDLGGVVVNADSMQVYRDLRVLTARPSVGEEAQVPHALYGVLDGNDVCTAARWRAMVLDCIASIQAAGQMPILCGGTGFYIKALVDGLSPMPDVPAGLRARVRAAVAADPIGHWERLTGIDPTSAQRMEPTDRQRVARALEVFEATGRTLSDWQSEPAGGPPENCRFLKIALNPPRDILKARCDARLDRMIDEGALEEVAALISRDLEADRPVMRALGVPEFASYLQGDSDLDHALDRAKIATRRYAKRQTTWLKTQFISDIEDDAQDSKRSIGRIFAFIRENGLIRS